MKIGVFCPTFPEDHVRALRAFSTGLARLGVNHFITTMDYLPCDVAVVFGVRKERVPASYPRGEIIRKHQGPAIIVEKGFVRRDEYFHVGWNGLNGRANFRNQGMPPDRWKRLGIELKPWRQKGQHIIVCGQVPWDASVQHHDHIAWCQSTVSELRRLTNRPVYFRPHPMVADKIDYGIRTVEVSSRALAEDLDNCHAVVTFNSNTAVDAAIEGVPVFAFDQGSMALRIADSDLTAIEDPLTPKREPWAHDLAYAQWNEHELAEGLAYQHLMRGIGDEERQVRAV